MNDQAKASDESVSDSHLFVPDYSFLGASDPKAMPCKVCGGTWLQHLEQFMAMQSRKTP